MGMGSDDVNKKLINMAYQFFEETQPATKLRGLQLDSLHEDCAELIQAISKMEQERSEIPFSNSNTCQITPYGSTLSYITEELSYILFTINLIAMRLGISQEEIRVEAERKLNKKYGIKMGDAGKTKGVDLDQMRESGSYEINDSDSNAPKMVYLSKECLERFCDSVRENYLNET